MRVGHQADQEAWNEAIAAWFFNESASGRPVYVCLDEAELARIALASGLTDGSAVVAFKAAMAACCPLPKDPFSYWRLAMDRWDQARPAPRVHPPFIALLGLTTLIVNEATRPGASREFYGRLAQVLNADVDSVKRDYEDTVRTWWAKLNTWLSEHEGRLGLPTAVAQETGHQSIIGHAWSQVVVRAPDRADFTEFFASLGIAPGEELELDQEAAPGELFLRWKAWVRQGGPVSQRLRPIVDDPRGAKSERGALVARIMADELAHWDGATRDAERRAVLRLVVTANTFDRHELVFCAVVSPEFAGRTLDFDGQPVLLGDAGDLAEVPVPVTGENLADGVRMLAGSTTVRYVSRAIVPLAVREADVWRSVDQLDPGEDAYALVADDATEAFFGLVPEPLRSSAVDNVPPGWLLYRDIEVDLAVGAAGGHAAALVPRESDLPHLRGGLRLGAARRYLASGAPDVVVPSVDGLATEVAVDGQVVACLGPGGGVVELAGLGLEAGEHTVTAGARRFRVVLEPFDWRDPPQPPRLAHVVPGRDLSAVVVRAPSAADGAVAAGPVVTGVEVPPLPVLLPVPDEVVLLGRPGEYQRVRPRTPPWAAGVGVPLGGFEPLARLATEPPRSFVPDWVVYQSAGVLRAQFLGEGSPSAHAKGHLLDWASEVLSLRSAAPEGAGADAAWRRYVERAEAVLTRV